MGVVDAETALLTILGGAIAGVIGFVATWYDRRLAARSRHLEEHKENLLVVSTSLVTLRNEIWPPTKSMANFEVVEGFPANVRAQFENFSLVNRPVLMRMSPREGDYEFVNIDRRLFADVAVHFPDLYRSLEAIDDLARTDGPRVLQPMYDLFDEIYKALDGRKMNPLYPGEDSQAIGLNRRYLASATFNELTGADRKDWPRLSIPKSSRSRPRRILKRLRRTCERPSARSSTSGLDSGIRLSERSTSASMQSTTSASGIA